MVFAVVVIKLKKSLCWEAIKENKNGQKTNKPKTLTFPNGDSHLKITKL